ncbi:MAG: GGDEF domain-containing protein [Proteobacteria bacterium]|nr:GGDEF domain-containing protein [Pseudomonadota bacterium]
MAVVLALTLASTGCMFLVISKQVRGRSGMATFALGLVLFGLVFAIPAQFDRNAPLLPGVLIDSVAVAAVLLLRRGLQRFMHRDELSWRALGLLLLGFAVISGGLHLAFGQTARHAVLPLVLGGLFAWLALTALRDAHRDNPLLRTPLLILSAVLGALAVLSLGEAVRTAFGGPAPGPAGPTGAVDSLYEAVLMLSALLLGPTLLWMHTVQLTRQFDELATRDPLTRLLNENGLDDVLRRHFSRRQHEPVVLMHVDIDQFGRVNRLHGEAAGDDVLRTIGLALESALRADDVVARVGDDEFVVACLSADVDKAAVLAERIRTGVSATPTGLSEGGTHLRCTVSVGLSRPFNDIEHWRSAWGEAEVSLNAAKDAGGNCVVHPATAPVPA